MIQMPRRSITRYFIPLIDVLILLFCMFLLVQNVREAEDQKVISTLKAESPQHLKDELKRLKDELDELKKRQLALVQPQAIRVLEVEPGKGLLIFYEAGRPPRRILVKTEDEARRLIERETVEVPKQLKNPAARPHFLIMLPRVDTAYPTQGQLDDYQKWFRGTSYSIARPGDRPERPGGEGE